MINNNLASLTKENIKLELRLNTLYVLFSILRVQYIPEVSYMGKLLKFEKQKGLGKKKNFFIAISVCLVSIGVATLSTYTKVKNNKQVERNIVSENKSVQEIRDKEANKDLQGVTVREQPKDTQQSTETSDNSDEKVESTANEVMEIVHPCASVEIMKPYSKDTPIYSKTFNDWRMHNGVDFTVGENEKILSITKGQVADVYDDPLLGKSIVINHVGDFTAIYSGFGEVNVEKDQNVDPKTELGTVGEIPSEILDGSHLHLVIKKQDQIIDPTEILK